MTTIWCDGALRPMDECRPSVLAHTLHYGVGVFEGIRAYGSDGGGGGHVFRLGDHLRRLHDSARVCRIGLPYDRAALTQACLDVLAANDLADAYLRPVVWQDDGELSGLGADPPVHVAIIAKHWGAYLGEDGLTRGIRTRISAYRRSGPGSFFSRAKINGQYVTSTLAKRDAKAQGVDEALLCDDAGHVCEGSGENLFLVRDGRLVTPPADAAILPGLTRHTVLHLADTLRDELGLTGIVERRIPRDALLMADEVFLTGTAAELTPVREVDDRPIGSGAAGPVALGLQAAYFDLVKGRVDAPEGWVTPFSLPGR